MKKENDKGLLDLYFGMLRSLSSNYDEYAKEEAIILYQELERRAKMPIPDLKEKLVEIVRFKEGCEAADKCIKKIEDVIEMPEEEFLNDNSC